MELATAVCFGGLSVAKDVATIIGTLGAVVIGAAGLFTWRRQIHFDLSKKILVLTFQVRDAIQAVRSPMLHLRKSEVEAGRSVEEEQRIYDERMRVVTDRWAELHTLSLEATAIWGEAAGTPFTSLRKLTSEIKSNLWMHFWLKGAYAAAASVDNSPERIAENDKIIYCISEDDDFSQKLDRAVADVEKFYRSRLRV